MANIKTNRQRSKSKSRKIDSRGYEQYYMSGANAKAVQVAKASPHFAREVKGYDMRKLPQAKDRPWPKLPIFALIFVLALLVAGEFALVQNMGLSVSRAQEELSVVQAENESLRNQASELSHLGLIEEKAQEELGMVKPGEKVTYTGGVVGDPSQTGQDMME